MVTIMSKDQIINFSCRILKMHNCTICIVLPFVGNKFSIFNTVPKSRRTHEMMILLIATCVSKDQRINFSDGC